MTLVCKNGRGDTLTIDGRVIDPSQGIDETLELVVEAGVFVRIAPASMRSFCMRRT